MAISCSNCGKELPDDVKFCGECGTQVAAMQLVQQIPRYCGKCDAELPVDAKFCLKCGTSASSSYDASEYPHHDLTLTHKLHDTSFKKQHYAVEEYDAVDDFERNKATLAMRANEWAEYVVSGQRQKQFFWRLAYTENSVYSGFNGEILSAWGSESGQCPTNKPNHHKALFYEAIVNHLITEAKIRGAIDFNTNAPTEEFIRFLQVREWTDEEIRNWHLNLPNVEEIRSWAHRDDELFPPPQPIRVEVAGAVLNFSTDDAVLVVYADCSDKGKVVEIHGSARGEELNVEWQKVQIVERAVGGSSICAAIFHPIPTDLMRSREKVINQVKVNVTAYWTDTPSQYVTLFKGNVTELDWRGGAKREPELSPQEIAKAKERQEWDFFEAIRKGLLPRVRAFLDENNELMYASHGTTSPLFHAAGYGQRQVVQLLLDRGADANERDSDGSTPLHIATTHGHELVVSLLIQRGANVNIHGYMQQTPLHIAASNGYEGIAQLLLDNGARINERNENKHTPLHNAVTSKHINVAKVLLQKGADVNVRDMYGYTPLYDALYASQSNEMATLLRSYGAKE